MKKILYCITLSEMGGAQKQLYSLIKGCHTDYKVHLACAPNGELIQWVNSLDPHIPIYELKNMVRSISPYKDILTVIELVKLIKNERFDIVHCHSSKAGLLGRAAAWLTGVPVRMFTVHGWSINDKQSILVQNFYKLLEKIAAYMSTHIVCVSEADRINGIRWGITQKDKLITIHNGSNPVECIPCLRKELGLGVDKFIVGTVARLSRQKNPLFSIKVYHELIKVYNNLIFVWIGDGPMMDLCRQEVKNLGIEDRFILLGNRNDVGSLIGDFNVFSLLSDWEGLPISIIEAMFAGLPIVATDVGGVNELVIPEINGFLVECGDIEGARDGVKSLMKDREKGIRFGIASKNMAYESFSETQMVENYQKIYNSGR